ncbi:MAG TPA: hypothetical protein VL989_01700 [Candidatus Sulfotelmatobacter sp.]|nr:hypothetical protein [Candidatus Sulfotelmatobacter sp.]
MKHERGWSRTPDDDIIAGLESMFSTEAAQDANDGTPSAERPIDAKDVRSPYYTGYDPYVERHMLGDTDTDLSWLPPEFRF